MLWRSFSPRLLGVFLALVGYFFFFVNDALRKWLIEDYDVLTILFWGALVGLVFLLPLARFFGKGSLRSLFRTRQPWFHGFRSLFACINFILGTYAFGYLPFVEAYSLVFVSPFLIAVMSFFVLKETFSKAMFFAVLVGFFGVLMVLRPGFVAVSLAHIAALGVAFFYSVTMLLSKKLKPEESRLSLAFFPVLSIALVSLVMTGFKVSVPLLGDWPLFVMSGFCYVVGMLSMSLAFYSSSGGLLAPLHYSQIIWGVLMGYFLFNEVPDLLTGIGAVVIVLAGLFLLCQEKIFDKETR